ncbi:MAG: aminotransferase class IV [Lachnospiraceae bacterium]|nr:aminotransferase class IV [Lachnospiraceae bacterium]
MEVRLDEGFLFGLGAFETVAVHDGRPVFLERHLERLGKTLEFLQIRQEISREEVYEYVESAGLTGGALKLLVTAENRLFLKRENPYTEKDYEKGFAVDFARTRRNESSPLTYHKTLNYGDCILENRRAKAAGLNEAVFLNSRGEICEGTVSNIFFVRNGEIFTPGKDSGLLPGIMRGYVLETRKVRECRITPGELHRFDECFLTNSLMGIMPVARLGTVAFRKRETADRIRQACREDCLRMLC